MDAYLKAMESQSIEAADAPCGRNGPYNHIAHRECSFPNYLPGDGSVGLVSRDYIICYETLTVARPKPLQLQKLLPWGGGIGNPRVPRVDNETCSCRRGRYTRQVRVGRLN